RHRQPRDRPRDRQGHGQERHREVLRRRHHPQAQAAREAEGRKETNEAGRPRGSPPGSVPHRVEELRGAMDVREEAGKVERAVEAPARSVRRRKSLVREYGEAILIAILLALVIRTLVVQAFTIPSGSMMDTLLVGDYILVNK